MLLSVPLGVLANRADESVEASAPGIHCVSVADSQ
jgi:hypothetical protein